MLVLHVPPFLRQGLDPDVTLWDLCARTVLSGGVFGRDAFENNLPGTLWLHMALRAVFGWRPEVLRGADLLIVLASVGLLVRSLPSGRGAVAALLLAFYFSTSEWCHCQRDTWMLLPALLALAADWRGPAYSLPRYRRGVGVRGFDLETAEPLTPAPLPGVPECTAEPAFTALSPKASTGEPPSGSSRS